MTADTHLYHLAPDEAPIVKYAVEVKTAAERVQWVEDAMTLPVEEKSFRASVVSAVNRLGPAPELTFTEVQARRKRKAERFKGISYREPRDLDDFLSLGSLGMRHIEENVGRIAAKRAIRYEQERWLPRLQVWAKHAEGFEAVCLRREIKRLRRILGRKQSKTERRAQTRERVRRHRARLRSSCAV